LFFALWPDTALRAALHDHALELTQSSGGRVIRPGNLHLTLAFLGNVARPRIAQLETIARGCAAAGFDLHLDKTGYWSRQHIVWMAPQNVPAAMSGLVLAMETALQANGFRVDAREWRPHITLLRDARAPAAMPPLTLNWPVREIVLAESTRGADYRVLARWPLAAT
jgi:2'-5' RNA ligase